MEVWTRFPTFLFLHLLFLTWSPIAYGSGADGDSSNSKTVWLSPSEVLQIRYSQSSIAGKTCDRNGVGGIPLPQLAKNMKEQKYDLSVGHPITIVLMDDGKYTTIDNRRLAAAQVSAIEVPVIIHKHHDPLPEDQIKRFDDAKTWGDAVISRMKRSESFDRIGDIEGLWGFERQQVRIRAGRMEDFEQFTELNFKVETKIPRLHNRQGWDTSRRIGYRGGKRHRGVINSPGRVGSEVIGRGRGNTISDIGFGGGDTISDIRLGIDGLFGDVDSYSSRHWQHEPYRSKPRSSVPQ